MKILIITNDFILIEVEGQAWQNYTETVEMRRTKINLFDFPTFFVIFPGLT